VRIKISIEKNVYRHYGLTDDEVSRIMDMLMEEAEKMIVYIYCKYSFEHRTGKNLKLMLECVNEMILPGFSKAKIIFNEKIHSNLLQVGNIIDSMDIKYGKERYRLAEFLFHMMAIKSQKAFINIK
jgi:hypothetical protein